MKKFFAVLLAAALLSSVCFVGGAEETAAETVFYYEDFENDLGGYSLYNTPAATVTHSTELGTGAMKITAEQSEQIIRTGPSAWTVIKKANEANPTKYVLEWRVLLASGFSMYSYVGTYEGGAGLQTGSRSGYISKSYSSTGSYAAMTDLKMDVPENVSVETGRWITLSCVYDYSGEEPSRTLYADGKLVGTSSEGIYTRPDGAIFNSAPFIAYLAAEGDTVYIDYVKMYTEAEAFVCFGSAEENIGLNSFDIMFSSTPSLVEAGNFSLGIGAPAIVSAERIGANTVRLTTEAPLSPSSVYSLTVSNLTDTLGRTLDSQTVELTTRGADIQETLLAFDDFDEIKDKEGLLNSNYLFYDNKAGAYTVSAGKQQSGEGSLKVICNEENGNLSMAIGLPPFHTEDASLADKPAALEMKIYSSQAGSSYLRLWNWSNRTDRAYNLTSFKHSAAGNTVYSADGSTEIGAGYPYANQWNTYVVLLDPDTDKQTVYINGQRVGTIEGDYSAWHDEADVTAMIMHYLYSKDCYFEMDYYRLSAVADVFDWSLQEGTEALSDSLKLVFNASVYHLSPDQIRVNGKAVKSVTLQDRKTNTYTAELAEPLEYETEYTIALNGVKDTMGRSITDIKTFTTEKDPTKVSVTFNDPKNGNITANGEKVNGSVKDYRLGETVTFIPVPDENYYVSSVKFGDVDLISNGEGAYTTPPLTGDAAVTVIFAEKEAAAPGIAKTYSKPFVSNGPVTVNGKVIEQPMGILFARILEIDGYALTDYGMEFAMDEMTLRDGEGKAYTAWNVKSPLGNYGVCFYGGFETGKTYYARPYAIYTKDGLTETVYGDIISFTPNPVAKEEK